MLGQRAGWAVPKEYLSHTYEPKVATNRRELWGAIQISVPIQSQNTCCDTCPDAWFAMVSVDAWDREEVYHHQRRGMKESWLLTLADALC